MLMISCSEKKQENQNHQNEKIVKQSEMAALMLEMYSLNFENKSLILAGKNPQKLPKEFYKIHSAKLTDSTDRNASFEAFSEFYLDTYQQLMNSSKDSLISTFSSYLCDFKINTDNNIVLECLIKNFNLALGFYYVDLYFISKTTEEVVFFENVLSLEVISGLNYFVKKQLKPKHHGYVILNHNWIQNEK